MPSNHLVLCHPLFLLPSIFPSIMVFSDESVLFIRWPKYWSFSFCKGPSNEYSGLISFRIDWFDLLSVQGILKSLLQHHSSKASVLRRSTFFNHTSIHDYWKTIALTRQNFVGKVLSLIFNMMSRLLIAFHPRNNSVQFSCWVMYDSLRPHELQHARPPYPSPTAGVYPNPCPLSRWCHPTISSSVVPFSSRPHLLTNLWGESVDLEGI